ncbi:MULTISPECIES: protein translocase SEC61 complex subunit gamma [Acidianus]|uniref:Protein translocase subunit SecE n=1 Tax=Candidatus Acidianus copahuensis TaxID=1160895 RepID=A0A031LR91_9CREN|nr:MULTISPECIES: protein translocase SEC61 complex subunit gamma [Acidianus]EZQ06909.1 preprotein translocase subunit SecE [Candidatus Acidianus copahuensis]NON61433.1 protein translocase SEC61 complex subunit gamma [Acidianus sp. RZ1]
MSLVDRIKRLPDDWRRIISVSKKPDKNTFNLYLKVTLIVMAFVGLIAFLIQLAVSTLHLVG